MIKRALLLNGVAILGVVVNHATGWTYQAMVWWADAYSSVTVPAYDQVSRPAYFIVLFLWQLPVFAVPAFLFTSGFFLAFALRGEATSGPVILRKRIIGLAIPYLIWSSVYIAGRALDLDAQPKSGLTYLRELVSTGVYGPYFFVPVLLQLYVVGFVMMPFVVRHPRGALCLAAVAQWGTLGISYLNIAWATPILAVLGRMTPYWTFLRWLFWYELGFVTCHWSADLTRFVRNRRRELTVAVMVLAVGAIVGPALLYESNNVDWRRSALTVSTSLYATAFIFWFLSIEQLPVQISRHLQRLSGSSYGIYLTHMPLMEICSRAIKRLAPQILAQHVAFGVIVFIVGLAGPLLLMEAVRRTPLRKAYRLLFG